MLFFVISVKNVGMNFSPSQGILCELASLIKKIIPDQNPEVYFEFSRAKRFIVKPDEDLVCPTEALSVEIYPQGGMINKGMINPDIVELAKAINTLVVALVVVSDTEINKNSPIRTSISICPEMNFKFSDHTLVKSF